MSDLRLIITVATLVVLVTTSQSAARTKKVVVFAAASLTAPITTLADKFFAEGLGKVTVSFASSSSLARQIDQGAPAAVFLSANKKWMDWLAGRNMIDRESMVVFTSNRLVLGTARSAKIGDLLTAETQWRKLVATGRLAVGETGSVPVGIYAKEALTSLGGWETVAGHLAPMSDVRRVILSVSRGETPYGVIYSTDAVSSGLTVAGIFPENSHTPIRYHGSVTTHGGEGAKRFLTFVMSPQGQEVLSKQGFIAP